MNRCTLTGRHTDKDTIRAWCRDVVSRHDNQTAYQILLGVMKSYGMPATGQRWTDYAPTPEQETIIAWAKHSPTSPFRRSRRIRAAQLAKASTLAAASRAA